MRHIFIAVSALLLILTPIQAHAGAMLVCQGDSGQAGKRVVSVDCDNRKEILNALAAGVTVLKDQNAPNYAISMCLDAFSQFKSLHSSIPVSGISRSYIQQCNQGLQFLK